MNNIKNHLLTHCFEVLDNSIGVLKRKISWQAVSAAAQRRKKEMKRGSSIVGVSERSTGTSDPMTGEGALEIR